MAKLEIREFHYIQQYHTWEELWERLKTKKISFEPFFDRDNWSIRKKSRFIESIFLNIDMPSFYFDATDNNNWLIVDGRKRLKAFYDFRNNNFALKDIEFEYFMDTEGEVYENLLHYYKLKFREQKVKIFILGAYSERKYREFFYRKYSTYSQSKIDVHLNYLDILKNKEYVSSISNVAEKYKIDKNILISCLAILINKRQEKDIFSLLNHCETIFSKMDMNNFTIQHFFNVLKNDKKISNQT